MGGGSKLEKRSCSRQVKVGMMKWRRKMQEGEGGEVRDRKVETRMYDRKSSGFEVGGRGAL